MRAERAKKKRARYIVQGVSGILFPVRVNCILNLESIRINHEKFTKSYRTIFRNLYYIEYLNFFSQKLHF